MDHVIERHARAARRDARRGPTRRASSPSTTLEPGQRLRIVKFVAYGWSGERSQPALRDQVAAAAAGRASTAGWDRLVAEQRAYLDDFWATR